MIPTCGTSNKNTCCSLCNQSGDCLPHTHTTTTTPPHPSACNAARIHECSWENASCFALPTPKSKRCHKAIRRDQHSVKLRAEQGGELEPCWRESRLWATVDCCYAMVNKPVGIQILFPKWDQNQSDCWETWFRHDAFQWLSKIVPASKPVSGWINLISVQWLELWKQLSVRQAWIRVPIGAFARTSYMC